MSSIDAAGKTGPSSQAAPLAADAPRSAALGLARTDGPLPGGPAIVSGVLLTMAAAIFAAVACRLLPDNSLVVGAAITWVTAVISYWIGSSAGSRRMGDTVRSIAVGAAPPTSDAPGAGSPRPTD